jgi:hypothetical protein
MKVGSLLVTYPCIYEPELVHLLNFCFILTTCRHIQKVAACSPESTLLPKLYHSGTLILNNLCSLRHSVYGILPTAETE